MSEQESSNPQLHGLLFVAQGEGDLAQDCRDALHEIEKWKDTANLAAKDALRKQAEIERLTQEWNETEECLAAILNELDLPFQDKDEPMAAYQERCLTALRAADETGAARRCPIRLVPRGSPVYACDQNLHLPQCALDEFHDGPHREPDKTFDGRGRSPINCPHCGKPGDIIPV
jgi:hypothetical protein